MAKKSKIIKSKTTALSRRSLPKHESDVPVTQGILYLVRDQLAHKIDSHDKRFASIDKRFDSIDKRFASIDKRFDSIDKRFASIDKRFDSIDKRFASIDKRFDSVDERFESLDKKIDSVKYELKADIAAVNANVSRVAVLMEEQNTRNKSVIDGLLNLSNRQDRLEHWVETRLKNMEDIVLKKTAEI
jgi:chromosome segregation ATPase